MLDLRVLAPRLAASGTPVCLSVGQAQDQVHWRKQFVGCRRRPVGHTALCQWECARNKLLMNLRSPASLGAGPLQPIHLLRAEHIKHMNISLEHTQDTYDGDIKWWHSKFQWWSVCPHLIYDVLATVDWALQFYLLKDSLSSFLFLDLILFSLCFDIST